jgi:hypothetical protein
VLRGPSGYVFDFPTYYDVAHENGSRADIVELEHEILIS